MGGTPSSRSTRTHPVTILEASDDNARTPRAVDDCRVRRTAIIIIMVLRPTIRVVATPK